RLGEDRRGAVTLGPDGAVVGDIDDPAGAGAAAVTADLGGEPDGTEQGDGDVGADAETAASPTAADRLGQDRRAVMASRLDVERAPRAADRHGAAAAAGTALAADPDRHRRGEQAAAAGAGDGPAAIAAAAADRLGNQPARPVAGGADIAAE